MLVYPLLLLTYTFTPKPWKCYQSFWSQKPNRWFCWLLVLAEERVYPGQVLLYNNPPSSKPVLQHHWLHPTHQWVGEDGWEGPGPLASQRVQTHALMSEQHLRKASGQNKLRLSRRSPGFGPSIAHFSTFLRQECHRKAPNFKCRKETVSTKADNNLLTGTYSAQTQGKHFCSHCRAGLKSKLYQRDT